MLAKQACNSAIACAQSTVRITRMPARLSPACKATKSSSAAAGAGASLESQQHQMLEQQPPQNQPALSPASAPHQQQQQQQQSSRSQQQPVAAATTTTTAALLAAATAAALLHPEAANALTIHTEPSNALSLPTWAIHVSSVTEWVAAMALFWRYAEVTGNQRWKGMTWGMMPALGSAMAACTWHFFYNSPDLDFLVALQAFLTVVGNCTCWFAAWRIYTAAQAEQQA